MVRIGSPLWRQCARRAAASWSAEGVLRLLKVLPSCRALLCESARAAILQPGLKEDDLLWCEWSDVRLSTLPGPLRVFTRIPQVGRSGSGFGILPRDPPLPYFKSQSLQNRYFRSGLLIQSTPMNESSKVRCTGYWTSLKSPTSIRAYGAELLCHVYLARFLVVRWYEGLTESAPRSVESREEKPTPVSGNLNYKIGIGQGRKRFARCANVPLIAMKLR